MDKGGDILFWLLMAGLVAFAVAKVIKRRKPSNSAPDGQKVTNGQGKEIDSEGASKNPDGEPASPDGSETGGAPPVSPPLNNSPAPPDDKGVEQEGKDNSAGSSAPKPPPAPAPGPRKNGAGERGTKTTPLGQPPRNTPPGIICWKNLNQQWVVGVEARPELVKLEVGQNGEPLEKERIPFGGIAAAFVCPRPDAPVEAVWEEDGEKKTCSPRVPCKKGAFAIFSMKSDWQGIGRRVGHATAGRCCIVIAPRGWSRIGSPPVADEAFRDDEHRAHYFKPEHGGELDGFRLPDGREKPLSPKRGRFELRGERMPGTHPDMPSLFGSAPPGLCDRQKWSGAAEIVVGGENTDARARPSSGNCNLDSLPALKEKRGGLFAVRVDDDKGEGLDAQLDFQFMRALRAINIRNARLLPGPGGHGTAEIAFQGECKIAPKELRQGVALAGCVAKIDARPDNDRTEWEIRDGDAKVEVEILLERIWWTRGLENRQPDEWDDKPLMLKLEDVSVNSAEGLWIKFPRAGFAENVYIGFSGAMKPYPVTARKSAVFAPFREFAIAAQQGGRDIQIGVGPENELETAAIARIVVPNAQGGAEVVRRGGRRGGKGFSPLELAAAGWTLARARRENLPVDTRRKTAHNWNIDTLATIGEPPP